jgi:general secretion pathway protein G
VKTTKAMRRDEKGFTLIELLIVIIILGILAVIGIPKFMNSKADAIIRSCQTNRSSLEDAGERYFFDTGVYPTSTLGQSALTAANSVNGWNGPYIKATFVCPSTNTNTYIFNTSTGAVTCSNTNDSTADGYHLATKAN